MRFEIANLLLAMIGLAIAYLSIAFSIGWFPFQQIKIDTARSVLNDNVCGVYDEQRTEAIKTLVRFGKSFRGEDIRRTELSGIDFGEISFQDAAADFVLGNEKTIFSGNLTNAYFRSADLRRVDFTRARVDGTVFCHSDLTGAKFADGALDSAILCHTNHPDGRGLSSKDCADVESDKGGNGWCDRIVGDTGHFVKNLFPPSCSGLVGTR